MSTAVDSAGGLLRTADAPHRFRGPHEPIISWMASNLSVTRAYSAMWPPSMCRTRSQAHTMSFRSWVITRTTHPCRRFRPSSV